MPKYKALVYRTTYASCEIELEAEDLYEVVEKACNMAPDIDFGRGAPPEYEVENITLVPEPEPTTPCIDFMVARTIMKAKEDKE